MKMKMNSFPGIFTYMLFLAKLLELHSNVKLLSNIEDILIFSVSILRSQDVGV